MVASYQGLSGEQIAHSSILTRTAQQLGGSFGTAIFAVLLQAAVLGGSTLGGAFQSAFWVAVGVTVLGVAIAFVLPGGPKRAAAVPAAQPVPEPVVEPGTAVRGA